MIFYSLLCSYYSVECVVRGVIVRDDERLSFFFVHFLSGWLNVIC